ncbi:OsmC family protein [Rhodoferax sp. 4810]|uniref:OsmC family protein n=1 Tax=Thiospirillum jenense TaxID=1653858 RepID=A0A839HMW7_9GAMM|nr:OsmC family protein [Thiospirillum jenense]MBB1075414.1 OsmC family protein [Rhodoferax jenense]MBB1126792.1 OsmC family protein [Thiospirillum jenense]
MSAIPSFYHTAYTWTGQTDAGNVHVVPPADFDSDIELPQPLPVGSPHDLTRYSPEHLLVFAAETCLANYVVLLARLSKLDIKNYCSTAEGELDQEDRAGYRFKAIRIRPELTVTHGKEAQAERILNKAHRLCLVARSLNCPVELVEPQILTE